MSPPPEGRSAHGKTLPRIAVVGAGIAGLAAAHRIRSSMKGARVVVLEEGRRPGGKIRSERVDDGAGGTFVLEHGPNGFLDSEPATLDLARRAGLGERLLRSADVARRRYVYRNRRLHRLPESPPGLVAGGLLSWRGKARVAADWLVPKASDELARRETVAEFARRRVGEEALEALVEPFVRGVFAGDPEQLELATAFPRVAALEREHGGLLRALVALERKRRIAPVAGAKAGGPTLTSFRNGMQELPDALAYELGSAMSLSTSVRALVPRPGGRWRIDLLRRGSAESLEADAVVLALPSAATARLVRHFAPRAAREMEGIPTAPIAVVHLGWRDASVRPAAFDGFGFLVARSERLRILGALAESSVWPGRTRGFLARAMLGGALDANVVALDDADLVALARADLREATGLATAPEFTHVVRWKHAIPQYVRGHAGRMARIDAALSAFPTLAVAGASWRGVAVNDLCRGGAEVAERIARALR